jgi:hypothetical protein
MSSSVSKSDGGSARRCIGPYIALLVVWCVLVVLCYLPRTQGKVWRPIREVVFGQAVFLDRASPFGASWFAPFLWLLLEFVAVWLIWLAIERRRIATRRSCWLRAVCSVVAVQAVFYLLGALVGE